MLEPGLGQEQRPGGKPEPVPEAVLSPPWGGVDGRGLRQVGSRLSLITWGRDRGRPPGWVEVEVLWLVLPNLLLYSSLLKWYLGSPSGQQTYPIDIGEG